MRELLSSVSMIADFGGIAVDFRVPNPRQTETVDALLNFQRYEQLLERRAASPYLEGEESDQAFSRLFGFMLPWAKEWQIIDQFLLEQLLSRRAVFSLLVRNLQLLPARTEIYSRATGSAGEPNGRFSASRAFENLEELRRLFALENRELAVFAYFPHPGRDGAKFPHPRIQKIRFDQGEIFTSLDNGFHSLAERAPVVYSEVGRHEWTTAQTVLAAMRREQVL
jgi:hypothetical protein